LRRKIIIAGMLILVITLAVQAQAGEVVVKHNEWTGHQQGFLVCAEKKQDIVKWYLDGQLLEENSTISVIDNSSEPYHYEIAYTFNSSQKGFHNISFTGTNLSYGTSNLRFWVYVGMMLILPNGTSTADITISPVITAPGEKFNVTTFIKPGVETEPIQWDFTVNTLDLLEPINKTYLYPLVDNSTNASTTYYSFQMTANTSNSGTLLIRCGDPLTVVNPDWESIAFNHLPTIITVSPRYDVNGDFVVNIIDLTMIRRAIRNPAYCPYPPRCDVNNDTVINIIDYSIVRANLGPVETV